MSTEKKETAYIEYFRSAKNRMKHAEIPGFEEYIKNVSSINPLLGHLDNSVFVIDYRTGEFLYKSPNTFEVEGYSVDEILRLGPIRYTEMIHPVDGEILMNRAFPEGHEEVVKLLKDIDFSRIRISVNFRLRQKDGSFRKLLMQFSFLMIDSDNNPLVTMGTVSNITDLVEKEEMFCRVSILDEKNKWKKMYERFYPLAEGWQSMGLTPKEIEIIRFVHKGFSSKEIATATNRSIETINSQRKSILVKTGCQGMTEVVVMAAKNGWV